MLLGSLRHVSKLTSSVGSFNSGLSEGRSISRASIINFLNGMVDQGVLGFRDATGKGGHQRRYYPLMDEHEYIKQVAKACIENLLKDFPEETKKALVEYL